MTRAIVIATRAVPTEVLGARWPVTMLPLLDRPFLQHVIEQLVQRGLTELDIIGCELPEVIEAHCDDGTRWGCTIHHHVVRDAARPVRKVRELHAKHAVPVLLVDAEYLPLGLPTPLTEPRAAGAPRAWLRPTTAADRYTGWRWLDGEPWTAVDDETPLREMWSRATTEADAAAVTPEVLEATTPAVLLASQQAVLNGAHEELLLTGRQASPGVWLSRNVALHPTAKLTPPLFIGADCQVGAGVTLGPNAMVGAGSVLDERSVINDALIFPGTFVGTELDVCHAIVDRNCLLDVEADADTLIVDDFILSAVEPGSAREWVEGLVSRMMGAGLLTAGLPMLLGLSARSWLRGRRHPFQRRPVVKLPASDEATLWKTVELWELGDHEADDAAEGSATLDREQLLRRLLPGLLHVARGELRLVGVTPRDAEELAALPREFRNLLTQSHNGLVTEALVNFGAAPNEDEAFSADAVYAVSRTPAYDLRLLGKLARKLIQPG